MPLAGSSGQAGKSAKSFWDSSREWSGTSPRKFPRKFLVVRKFRPPGRKLRPWNFFVEFWLSLFGFSSREGPRRFWEEVLPGDFWPAEIQAGSSGPRPEVPVLYTGNSGPALFQRPDFLEGYLYPSTYLGTASSCNPLSSLKEKPQIEEISQSLHPNSLIFGGLKEKPPIYNFTNRFSISPSFA